MRNLGTRRNRTWWAAACSASVLGLLVGIALVLPADQHASAQDTPGASECTIRLGKTAAPSVVSLGESAIVALTAVGECPSKPAPGNVVLLVDRSLSMANQDKLVDLKLAAQHFVDVIDLATSQVGVVTFAADAEVLTELTSDRTTAREAIDSIGLRPSSNISVGIDSAGEVIERGRTPGMPPTTESIILMSDGSPNGPRPDPRAAALAAAERAKAMGIQIASVCVGLDCDEETLRHAASHDDLFFVAHDHAGLDAWMEHLAGVLLQPAVLSLTITDTLPANMHYVDGSAAPSPYTIGADWLSWTWLSAPLSGVTASLRVEPLELGLWPTNALAEAVFTDTLGLTGSQRFPVPEIDVRTPAPKPSSTPTATVTATTLATATATATADSFELGLRAALPSVLRAK